MQHALSVFNSFQQEIFSHNFSEIYASFNDSNLIQDFIKATVKSLNTFFSAEHLDNYRVALINLISKTSPSVFAKSFFEFFCVFETLSKLHAKKKLPSSLEKSIILLELCNHRSFFENPILKEAFLIFNHFFSQSLSRSTIDQTPLEFSQIDMTLSSFHFGRYVPRPRPTAFRSAADLNKTAAGIVRLGAFMIFSLLRPLKVVGEKWEEAGPDFELFSLRMLLKNPDSPFAKNLFSANLAPLKKLRNFTKKTLKFDEIHDLASKDPSLEGKASKFAGQVCEMVKFLTENLNDCSVAPVFRLGNFLMLYQYALFKKTGQVKLDFSWDLEIIKTIVPCVEVGVLRLILVLEEVGVLRSNQKFSALKEELGMVIQGRLAKGEVIREKGAV